VRYTDAERAAIAKEYDGYADGLHQSAAALDAEGHDIAAQIQRDLAHDHRDVANAARTSSNAPNHLL
jgi:hypothetical protein